MTTLTAALTGPRLTPRHLLTLAVERLAAPTASLLVAAAVAGAGLRVLLVVAVPVLLLGLFAHRLPRGARAAAFVPASRQRAGGDARTLAIDMLRTHLPL